MRVDGEEPGDLDLATMFYYGSFDEECYGLTIGPGYATTTIEQVRGYLPVCLQQGWISGYPFVKDLDAPLGKAQKLRDSGDVSGMVSALEETVKKLEEVRSYKRKTYEVTHEAYALIRYNCEHLIRQHSDKE
ncbi:MAG: hypothetical protein GY851_23970, partial [bacterium]|nr:hypothetical protein [bacterium]